MVNEPSPLNRPVVEASLLAVGALVLYWVTGPAAGGDMWPPLADAFLNGRLHLVDDRPWLELVPRPEGGQYVPLPPVPALTLVPATLLFGELDGNVYAKEQAVLRQSGTIRGNISAPRVVLEDGSRFKGSIDMEAKEAARSEPLKPEVSRPEPPASAPSGPGLPPVRP